MRRDLIEADRCLSGIYRLCREQPPIGERPRSLRWMIFDGQFPQLSLAYGLGVAGQPPAAWAADSLCAAAYLAGGDGREDAA